MGGYWPEANPKAYIFKREKKDLLHFKNFILAKFFRERERERERERAIQQGGKEEMNGECVAVCEWENICKDTKYFIP